MLLNEYDFISIIPLDPLVELKNSIQVVFLKSYEDKEDKRRMEETNFFRMLTIQRKYFKTSFE